jgi:hypothetical protein
MATVGDEIDNLTERISTKNRVIYTAGADYTLGNNAPFFIEVPSGGGSVNIPLKVDKLKLKQCRLDIIQPHLQRFGQQQQLTWLLHSNDTY